MKTYEIEKLNELYTKADNCDKSVFNEMKSNVKLVAGEHYEKNAHQSRELYLSSSDKAQKVRIVKNLIQKISLGVQDGIMALSPELRVVPFNETELSDRKAAELYDSVLAYGKERYKLEEKKEDWCQDFVDLTEVCVKISFNKEKGDFAGYHQKVKEGLPIYLDSKGQETMAPVSQGYGSMGELIEVPHRPAPDKDRPAFSGDFVFDQIFPADLLRCPTATSMDDSPYLIIRKMMDMEEAKRLVSDDDPERDKKLDSIKKSSEETYRVFDLNTHSFEDSKGKAMIREYYWKPCYDHPNGYYVYATETAKLLEGELPFGIFPIAWRAYKKRQTTPRGTGVIKVARPYQVELNRASSKQIEHQITHGDDKVFTATNAKIDQTSHQAGIRHFRGAGAPVVIPGRVGEQYSPYIKDIVQEMFFAVNEETQEQDSNQLDPVALLYKSVRRKSRYGRAAREFQSFLKEVYWIYLNLSKHYFDDDRKIKAIGRSEAINLAEFKQADPTSVQIKLVGSNEDAESQIGKYLMFQNVLQYVGKDLPKETIGKILVNMPYANMKDAFKELVQDTKNIENDILALDRGETFQADPDDKHDLYIKALTSRIKSPDFMLLPDQVQQNYFAKREEHRALAAKQAEEMMRAKMEMIPTDGPLTKADLYTNPDPTQPTKVQRAVFPARALEWLQAKLNEQMLTQDRLQSLEQADVVAMSQMVNQQNPFQGGFNGTNGSPNTAI